MPDSQHFDVVVVGGGPAGIAAAVCAAESGARVGIVDDNAILGGQIWRGGSESAPDAIHWRDRLEKVKVTKLCGKRIFHQPRPDVLFAESDDGLIELRYNNLILATGARERFLPFPGWTLPNVMGAGGLQAMVKSGLPVQGKRVVVAGTGPLLLAVAAYLRKHGAEIAIICEQASWTSLIRFGLTLTAHPAKISQARQLKQQLSGIPFAAGSWPLSAHGQRALESVAVSHAGKQKIIPCDYLACGFHLAPNLELAQLLGCVIKDGYVEVDDFQQTTVKGIFCAGEPTGIGGLELALIEGQIAGLAVAGQAEAAKELLGRRAKARAFARALDRTFRLRPELRTLATNDSIVCRCEDVRCSQLKAHASWRAAKLHTRCGMGPCQGRICGPALEFLMHWQPDSVRPPIFPAHVGNLAGATESAITGECV